MEFGVRPLLRGFVGFRVLYRVWGLGLRGLGFRGLGSPVAPFCPFWFGVSLLNPNSRKKGALIIIIIVIIFIIFIMIIIIIVIIVTIMIIIIIIIKGLLENLESLSGEDLPCASSVLFEYP